MSRSARYATPIKASDGTEAAPAAGRGRFTLASGTTYVVALDTLRGPSSVQVEWDAAIILTSVTPEDCNAAETEIPLTSTTAGQWLAEDPSTAYVSAENGTATQAVVAVAGGSAGGAMWHFSDMGCRRLRLTIVVGGTGGVVRISPYGRE